MTKVEELYRAMVALEVVRGVKDKKKAQRQLEAVKRNFRRPAFASLCVPQRA